MSIIGVRDNENNRWKRNAKNNKKNKQRQKGAKGTEAIVTGWELDDFVVHLSQVFSSKASYTFKSNLKLALSFILNQRECSSGVKMFENMRLVFLFDMPLFLQINHYIAFLDVLISGINNQNLTLQTYHKSTYTGLQDIILI